MFLFQAIRVCSMDWLKEVLLVKMMLFINDKSLCNISFLLELSFLFHMRNFFNEATGILISCLHFYVMAC